jgi:hypothetical protein
MFTFKKKKTMLKIGHRGAKDMNREQLQVPSRPAGVDGIELDAFEC